MYKKAWVILFLAACLFMVFKTSIPKDLIYNNTNTPFESLLQEQIQDTLNSNELTYLKPNKKHETKNTVLKKATIDPSQKKELVKPVIRDDNANRKGLSFFFKKLKQLESDKTKQVRIGFFGDSMEDADMIVMQLRHYLQQKFGGQGVGYVSIQSATAKGRYSIKHRFSKSWNRISFMKKGYGRFPFGLNGTTFYVGDSLEEKQASVTYKRGSAYKELKLVNPVLFYGKAINNSLYIKQPLLTVSTDSGIDSVILNPKALVNTHRLPNGLNMFTLSVTDKQTTPFYGVSFASKNGIIVDNLSVRGNSGLPLAKLNISLMQAFDKHLNYDLIVLAFGTNVFSFDNEKYGWYKSRMLKIIKHIKHCFPNADILIMSMGDRSTKIDGIMQTPEHLPDFITVQHHIAKASNSGFFNLYSKMGGKNSMVQWVEEKKWANKDYTHFNPKGAKKAGEMMYQWLYGQYTVYKKNNDD